MTVFRANDLTGRRFDALVVVRLESAGTHGKSASWRCRCDCGTEVVRSGKALTRRDHAHYVKSCGCRAQRGPGGERKAAVIYTAEVAALDLAAALGIRAPVMREGRKHLLDADWMIEELATQVQEAA